MMLRVGSDMLKNVDGGKCTRTKQKKNGFDDLKEGKELTRSAI